MPRLDPGIHDFLSVYKDVDGRDKPGHDEQNTSGTSHSKPLDSIYPTG
jgi:hypothetical protein